MRRTLIILTFVLVSLLAFAQIYRMSITRKDGQIITIPTDEISKIEFIQDESPDNTFKVVAYPPKVPYFGGTVTFTIVANGSWIYEVDKSTVREVQVSGNRLVLDFPANTSDEEVNYNLTFQYADMNIYMSIEQDNTLHGDLLDIEFQADGTAIDISPMEHEIITKPSINLFTYYNDLHKRYVASLRNTMGAEVSSGYYRIKYSPDGEFIKRIADGCTFESIIKLNDLDNPAKEVKWFSSMQNGGIGFILPKHDSIDGSDCITFLPNVSTNGESNYRWTYSCTKPEVGKYYHVTGVWNKEEGKSYIYINGSLDGTQSAPGNYVPVVEGAESFIIGGDPNANDTDCDDSFYGEIVSLRVYDKPLTAGQVEKLWKASQFEQIESPIVITRLTFLSNCQIAPGVRYSIYGNGFADGDAIEFVDESGNILTTKTEVCSDRIITTIPDDIATGSYNVTLKRDDNSYSLFKANFTLGTGTIGINTPKAIAHRGEHTDGTPENSLEALSKAMDSNYYGIELDTWCTTDGVIVVNHDDIVNGHSIQNNTYNKIKEISSANGKVLPTLESFIKLFKEKMDKSSSKLIIEIKPHSTTARNKACINKVFDMIDEAGIKDRVEYIAFGWNNCRRIVVKDRDAIVGYLDGDKDPATLKSTGIKSMDYAHNIYSNNPDWIKEAKALGLIVNVWTVNAKSEMINYMNQGVDYITTDDPATLTEIGKMKFIEE